jgi:glycosyltransferase involved in cell wall biosynthesis
VRIAIVTDDHPPMVGGIAVFVARVAEELVRRGHEVRVVARDRPGVAAIPGTTLTTVRGPLRAWRAALEVRRADRVLATTWPVATGLARLRIPFDVVAHGSDVTRPPRDRAAFDRVWSRAGRRFALSRFLAHHVDGEVLPAPIPVADRPRERGEGWVLVARATPLKGGDRFVRWVEEAGVPGIVVGDGPELPRWRRLAGPRVEFRGACSAADTLAIVRGAELAVLVPRADVDGTGAEGFGFALVEAMGQGVPAAGCRTGGVPEAVGPGLVVTDPDDAGRSVVEVRAFLGTDPGPVGWAWVRDHHGPARTVDAWLGPSRRR